MFIWLIASLILYCFRMISFVIYPIMILFVIQSYSLNITTVKGFEIFMESLKRNSKQGASTTGVDLVLSCVDNYEARMVVNQVIIISLELHIKFCSIISYIFGKIGCLTQLWLFRHAMSLTRHGWSLVREPALFILTISFLPIFLLHHFTNF